MCWWSQAPCKTLREWKPTTIPWVWGSYLENEERAGSFQVICYRLSQWSPLRYTAGVTDELWPSLVNPQTWSLDAGSCSESLQPDLSGSHPPQVRIVLTVTSLELGESAFPRTGGLWRSEEPSCQHLASSHPHPQTQPLSASGSQGSHSKHLLDILPEQSAV